MLFSQELLLLVTLVGSFLSPLDMSLSMEGHPRYFTVATALEEGGLSKKYKNQNFVVWFTDLESSAPVCLWLYLQHTT